MVDVNLTVKFAKEEIELLLIAEARRLAPTTVIQKPDVAFQMNSSTVLSASVTIAHGATCGAIGEARH